MLITLTALSLIGFTAATLTITDADGNPPLESRMVFAGLSAVYVLFFNFCKDMNDPFDGVYQIKRSSAASYLLQIKWLIANQPFGADVKFDTRGLDPVYDGNVVCEVGEGCSLVDPEEGSSSSSELPSQATSGSVVDDPAARLHQMKEELRRLKQLHQKISQPDSNGYIDPVATEQLGELAKGAEENRSFAKEAAEKVEVAVPKTSSATAFIPERK